MIGKNNFGQLGKLEKVGTFTSIPIEIKVKM